MAYPVNDPPHPVRQRQVDVGRLRAGGVVGKLLPVLAIVLVLAGGGAVIYIGLQNKKNEQAAVQPPEEKITPENKGDQPAAKKQPNAEPKQSKQPAETDEQRAAREAAARKKESERIAKEKANASDKELSAAEKLRVEKERNETLAANSLKAIKLLINAGKQSEAKVPLTTLINSYPNTQAANEAREILKSIP